MNLTPHPAVQLHPDWLNLIRQTSDEGEDLGYLPAQLLELIFQQGWLKSMVPRAYGGLELSLPEIIRLEEALSWADGSLGWTLTLCSGAGWFGAFVPAVIAEEFFAAERVCIAGSGMVSGKAERNASGFLVNGNWKYASGAVHATAFTANCFILENGESVSDNLGNPLVLPFIFKAEEVNVLPTWKTMGLKATGSHAFEVKDLGVSENRCFEIHPAKAKINSPVYQYPFLQLAETTLAINSCGMAIRFLDLCSVVFEKKSFKLSADKSLKLSELLNHQEDQLIEVRNRFYQSVDASWTTLSENKSIPKRELKNLSYLSVALAKTSRQVVDELYPLCGLEAANPQMEINRVWRNLHTASQHALLNCNF